MKSDYQASEAESSTSVRPVPYNVSIWWLSASVILELDCAKVIFVLITFVHIFTNKDWKSITLTFYSL